MTPSRSEQPFPHEVVERFPADASQDVKRAFAQKLVGALEKVAVAPGAKFVVMRDEDYDAMIEAQEDDMKVLQEELDCEREQNDHESKLWEMVEDLARGVRTADEIVEFVTRG